MKQLYRLAFLMWLLFSLPVHAQDLLHYWNFNNSVTLEALLSPTSSTVGGASIAHLTGGISSVQFTSNTGQGFDVTNPNARNGDAALTHLRFNDPIGGGLLFSLPTIGYKDVVLKYATRRSGSGAGLQRIEYTTDGVAYTTFGTVAPVDGNPTLITLDFSAITAVNNNPNFKVRITFEQGAGGTVGNNRFDNVTLEGVTTSGTDTTPPTIQFSPLQGTVNVETNVIPSITFNEDIRLVDNTLLNNSNVDAIIDFRFNNASGSAVAFDAVIEGRTITINPVSALSNNQTYYVGIKANAVEDFNDNAITTAQGITFTTIAEQTVFAAGDLLLVGYRMNSTGTDDEIAFVTFVNIKGGTRINFTDAKFTDNAQPQCPGGFTWIAPSAGVPSGSVVRIKPDANPPVPSVGTTVGSGFGLSANGDQIIVYTGTAAAPAYITALSSNAWLESNTTCNGSLSKRPGSLTESMSISLATSPNAVAGNTTNAYYNGPVTGTSAYLKSEIVNPANWVGTASGTVAQTWPAWAFPGPPFVVSAAVSSSTSITLAFSSVLDNASASSLSNYTGISGLQSAILQADGKTVVLYYANAFSNGSNYSLQVNNIKDSEGKSMIAAYTFNVAYNTVISFASRFLSINEGDGSVSLKLNIVNPSPLAFRLSAQGSPFSTALAADYEFTSQVISLSGNETTYTLIIPVNDDAVEEQDEYFVIKLDQLTGATLSGSEYATIYIKDNDRKAPLPTKDIQLTHVNSFDPGSSTAEIVMHDPATQRLFSVSSIQDRLDIADFSDPSNITLIKSVDMTPYGGITSVAVKNGIVAVAVPNVVETESGSVVFLTTDGTFLNQVPAGVLPDMVTFSPDGRYVMTANEGQPNNAYTIDPEGSITLIDISKGVQNVNTDDVYQLSFQPFNAMEASLMASGVRKLKASSTLAQDLEPEYITISADSKTAWVTLQENNAIATVDLDARVITSIQALGTKDYSAFGNGFDASDNSGIIHISNWPVKAFFIPDAVSNYVVNGVPYIITANEGDEKEYAGLNERTTVGAVKLDPTVFPNAKVLQESFNLGRLRMSNLHGDIDNDGDFDELFVVGSRSFSIWNANTLQRVYDSGDDFEMITAHHPMSAAIFNADNEGNGFKSRSRAKGPEPEGLTIANINDRTYAFIALERVGGVMVYDITDPAQVKYVDYVNSRSLTTFSGDHGPEGIIYIASEDSPTGKGYVVVANEISGTISVFEIKSKQTQTIVFPAIADKKIADGVFTVQATSTSGLPISFTAVSNNIQVAGNQVTLLAAGRATISAEQGGDGNFFPATPAEQTFCINPAAPQVDGTQTATAVTLYSSVSEGNQWYKDGVLITGATSASLSVVKSGVYTVTTQVDGCVSARSNEYVVIIPGEKDKVKGKVKMKPNPVSDYLEVSLPFEGRKEIRVYQNNGLIKDIIITNEEEITIDVRKYKNGAHILSVTSASVSFTERFVKR